MEISPWAWFIVGGILLVAEIFAPGTFLLWLGLSAVITGVIASFLALPFTISLVIFAAVALMTVLIGRKITPPADKASDRPFLNRRAESYIGRSYRLDEPIRDGIGHIRIGDTIWRVEGPDLAAEQEVRVVAVDGAILKVEPA